MTKYFLLHLYKVNYIDHLNINSFINLFFSFKGIGLGSIEFMKSRNFENVKENYKRNYKELMINAYKLWPLAQSINFFLIPLKFRFVFKVNNFKLNLIIKKILISIFLN